MFLENVETNIYRVVDSIVFVIMYWLESPIVKSSVLKLAEYAAVTGEKLWQIIHILFSTRKFPYTRDLARAHEHACTHENMRTLPKNSQRSNNWAFAWTRAWLTYFRSLPLFQVHPTKFPRSTSATRAISVLSSSFCPYKSSFPEFYCLGNSLSHPKMCPQRDQRQLSR